MTDERWPTEPRMPALVDGELSIEQLREAIKVLHRDGPEEPMTLSEVVAWLELHVTRTASSPPPDPDARTRRRSTARPDVGRPGRMRSGASAAA